MEDIIELANWIVKYPLQFVVIIISATVLTICIAILYDKFDYLKQIKRYEKEEKRRKEICDIVMGR